MWVANRLQHGGVQTRRDVGGRAACISGRNRSVSTVPKIAVPTVLPICRANCSSDVTMPSSPGLAEICEASVSVGPTKPMLSPRTTISA